MKYDRWMDGGLFSEQLRDVEEGLSQFEDSEALRASGEESE